MGKKRAPHVSVPAYWVPGPGAGAQSPTSKRKVSLKKVASIATRHLDPKQAAHARAASKGGKKGGKKHGGKGKKSGKRKGGKK